MPHSISCTCPNCATRLIASPAQAGKAHSCPRCRTVVVLPYREKPANSNKVYLGIVSLLLVLCCVFCLGIGYFLGIKPFISPSIPPADSSAIVKQIDRLPLKEDKKNPITRFEEEENVPVTPIKEDKNAPLVPVKENNAPVAPAKGPPSGNEKKLPTLKELNTELTGLFSAEIKKRYGEPKNEASFGDHTIWDYTNIAVDTKTTKPIKIVRIFFHYGPVVRVDKANSLTLLEIGSLLMNTPPEFVRKLYGEPKEKAIYGTMEVWDYAGIAVNAKTKKPIEIVRVRFTSGRVSFVRDKMPGEK